MLFYEAAEKERTLPIAEAVFFSFFTKKSAKNVFQPSRPLFFRLLQIKTIEQHFTAAAFQTARKKTMKTTERLGTQNITKLLLEFSLPAIIAMIIQSLYNIISRIYIGNSPDLGLMGIAGITVAFPIMMIFFAIASMSGIGGATLYAISLGEKNLKKARTVLGNAFFLMVLTSALPIAPCLIWMKELLIFFGASPEILPYAYGYTKIIVLGNVFQAVSYGLNNFVRSDGHPKTAMVTIILGALFNIVMAPVFIYIFGWGMEGAALAVVGGQLLTMIWVTAHFLSRKRSSVQLKLSCIRPRWQQLYRIAATGTPPFLLQLVNSVQTLILNRSLLHFGGETALTAMGIVMALQTLLIMPIVGISNGAQPIIGYNFGARRFGRIKEALKKAIIGATAITCISYAIMFSIPEKLILLFNNDAELVSFGKLALRLWFMCLPVVGFQIVSSSYFQAIGKIKPATVLSLTRQLLIFIPSMLLLPRFFGLHGLLFAAPLSDLTSAILTAVWLSMDLKTLGKDLSGTPLAGETLQTFDPVS